MYEQKRTEVNKAAEKFEKQLKAAKRSGSKATQDKVLLLSLYLPFPFPPETLRRASSPCQLTFPHAQFFLMIISLHA